MKRVSSDGSTARFERLFSDTRHDLLAYTLRRSKSPEDAADVLAETYLIAWQKLDAVPQGDEARLWLFGVARNVLLRGASRERSLQHVVARLAHELRDLQASVETSDDTRESALREALTTLSERQREVLLLTAWEDLTPREIAAVTSTPVNLVRVRLHRARARLRRELAVRATWAAGAGGDAGLESSVPHHDPVPSRQDRRGIQGTG